MAQGRVHAGYDVYIGDNLTRRKAHAAHQVNANSATLRIKGTADDPEDLVFTEVDMTSNTRKGREHTIAFTGVDAEGASTTVTLIKLGCGCGGR